MKKLIEYKFQFNCDTESCDALKSMLKDGWEIKNFIREDGYSWFILNNLI